MFEFDAGKLVIIGIVALIVIGPKELPRVLRQVGQTVAKLRHMAAEFQSQFMDAMREAEIADLKAEAAKLAEMSRIDTTFDPVAELKGELTRAIDVADPPTPHPAGEDAAALTGPADAEGPAGDGGTDGAPGPRIEADRAEELPFAGPVAAEAEPNPVKLPDADERRALPLS